MKSLINSSHAQDICLISYNSRGFCQLKQEFVRQLISLESIGSSLPILCNQENFILKGNLYRIRNALPDYHVIMNPAVRPNSDTGRPRNGMFVAVPETLKNFVTDVSPGFWRLQAIILTFNTTKVLLINSSLPVDSQANNFDETELLETLTYVKNILRDNDYDGIIWC